MPVPQFKVGGAVTLDDSNSVELLNAFLVVPSGEEAPAERLEVHDKVCDLVVPFFFEMGEDAGPEEYLRLTDAIEIPVELQALDHRFACLFAVHETWKNLMGLENEIV